jgi:hypothetical protein
MEIWLETHISDSYLVSNLGRVKSLPKRTRKGSRILKNQIFKCGYSYVDLVINAKIKKFTIHRLMAMAFIPNPKNKPQVNHKDGIKNNNMLSNIEWSTRSENQKHSITTGLRTAKGVKNSQCKLTENIVISIYNDTRNFKQISESNNISLSTIYDIKNGRSWLHVTKDLMK